MKPIRLFCILLCLCLLFGFGLGCEHTSTEDHPTVHVTYTPDPTTVPAELIEAIAGSSSSFDDPQREARVYGNDWITLYRAYRNKQPGIRVESREWSYVYTEFFELPGTEGLTELTITKMEIRPEGQRPEAYVLVYYLDTEGKERILCADNSHENYTEVYPLSAEAGLKLTQKQQQYYEDLLLMGYIRERLQGERSSDPEGWERTWQRCILDALYYNYGDALPPYLIGEGTYGQDEHAAVVSLTELENFFQSTLGLPCVIRATEMDREEYPALQPDQIVLYPTDYFYTPHVKQAVQESDGTICLYGYIGGLELMDEGIICRIRPVDGYLGGQLLSAEIYPAQILERAEAAVTPAPARPQATPSSEPDPVKAAARLYEGESSIFYRGYREGRPGICVEQLLWRTGQNMLYQELPGTEGLSELTVTGIEAKPEGQLSKAYVYVRYLDNAGQERIVCFDHYGGDVGECYPVSDEPGLELTEEEQSTYNDLLLIGYLYEDYQRDKDRLSDPEHWETHCQQFILDALYESYDETLPPYLAGEGIYDDELQDTAVLSQTELEAFFQSVLGRPNLVPDRLHYDEDFWPGLQPGQVPLPPTDTFVYAEVKQAVREQDGTITLYGMGSWSESFYSAILICRIRPAEGFLGYRIESTEMCPVMTVTDGSSVTFAS